MNEITSEFLFLCKKDWWKQDLDVLAVQEFLRKISRKDNLKLLLDNLLSDPELIGLCEHLKSLDKLVLLNHPDSKTRVRLHYFKKGSYDLLHNHRWPFVSLLIKGKLVQTIYTNLNEDSFAFQTVHDTNDVYFLSTSMFHKLRAMEDSLTIVLRGPDLIETSEWKNLESSEVWRHSGGKKDDKKIDMSIEALNKIVTDVLSL